MEQLKELKVVFGDYNTDSFALANAKISNVNLYKKTNKLELFLQSQELIPMSELEKFELYAQKRFNFNEVSFKISFQDNNIVSIDGKPLKKDIAEINKAIKNDWKNILGYMSKKVPVIKAFLKNSTIDLENNTIDINLTLKGKDLLEKQGIDKYISDFINNIYSEKYKIVFKEDNIAKFEDEFLKQKENIVKKFSENSAKVIAEHKEQSTASENSSESNQVVKKVYSKTDWNGQNANSNWKNSEFKKKSSYNASSNDVAEEEPVQEDPSLIYGRNSNIKEN